MHTRHACLPVPTLSPETPPSAQPTPDQCSLVGTVMVPHATTGSILSSNLSVNNNSAMDSDGHGPGAGGRDSHSQQLWLAPKQHAPASCLCASAHAALGMASLCSARRTSAASSP